MVRLASSSPSPIWKRASIAAMKHGEKVQAKELKADQKALEEGIKDAST